MSRQSSKTIQNFQKIVDIERFVAVEQTNLAGISSEKLVNEILVAVFYEQLTTLIGIPWESSHLKQLRKAGIDMPTLPKVRRPTRQRDSAKAIAFVLLNKGMSSKEVSLRLGFKLTKDSYGNYSYSRTGRRYLEYGRRLLRTLRRDFRVTFKTPVDKLPEMYYEDSPISESLTQTSVLYYFYNSVTNIYEEALGKEVKNR